MPERSRQRRPARRVGARAALALGVAVAAGCAPQPPADPPRPSILLITLDTVRADRLGSYGYDKPTTPRLDALAGEGVLFRNAVAQSALTPVSHASILTGLWPPNHGLRVLYAGSGYRLPEAVPTLAEVLGGAGYRTGAFLSAFPVSEFFGLDRGFELFDNGLQHDAAGVMSEQPDGGWRFDTGANQRRSDATTDAVLAWLDGAAGPFLGWVHYWDTHDPWLQPPEEDLAPWISEPPARRARWLSQLYDAEMHFVDRQIGRLLDGLRERGLDDETIVVVVSDHGEGLGDHGHWHHRILYQEQIHVPLIVRIPGGVAGEVVESQVRTTDIFPTLLELAGVESPMRIDGKSLLPLLAAGAPRLPRPAYAEALIAHDLNAVPLLRARPDDAVLHAWSDGEWKLIHKPRNPERGELYHLVEDPRESRNRFAERQDVVRRLLFEMEQLQPYAGDDFGRGEDPDVIERLRSLGYVD